VISPCSKDLVDIFPTQLDSPVLEFIRKSYCSSGTRQKSCLAVVPLVCIGSTAPPGAVLLWYAGALPPAVLPRKVPRPSGSGTTAGTTAGGTVSSVFATGLPTVLSRYLPRTTARTFDLLRSVPAVLPEGISGSTAPGSNGSATRYRRSWELVLPSTARRPAAVVPLVPGGSTACPGGSTASSWR
jgi:hypothetical protein